MEWWQLPLQIVWAMAFYVIIQDWVYVCFLSFCVEENGVRTGEVIAGSGDVPCKHCCNSSSRINSSSWIELQGYLSSLFATGPHFGTCCRGMLHVCDITCGWVDSVVMLSYLLSTFSFTACQDITKWLQAFPLIMQMLKHLRGKGYSRCCTLTCQAFSEREEDFF